MEIKLPELGEGVNSAKVVDILVSEGDKIKEGDDVIEVETDKAVAGVPANAGGKVTAIKVSKGDDVSVGDVLVVMDSDGGGEDSESKDEKESESKSEKDSDSSGKEKSEKANKTDDKSKDEEGDKAPEKKADPKDDSEESKTEESSGKPDIGPPAGPELRRMARELGIDLDRVRGTERGGRITAADVRSYVKKLQDRAFSSGPPGGPYEDLSRFGPIESEDLPAIRKTISERLLTRWRSSPLVTQFGEADISRIMDLKEQFTEKFEDEDSRLTLSCFFIMALVPLLEKYPKFNASLDLEAEKIIYRRYQHFGIAVATEKGLMVPVMRNAHEKSILEVARELDDLSSKARDGKLRQEDMLGAGFYISNQGAIGGGHFTPLLSGSESAILGIGRSRPIVIESDDGFKSVPVVPLSLSYDHRLIDGAEAATFMKELEESLSDFDESVFKELEQS